MYLAIDVGHGYVKTLSDTNRTLFPALIAPAPALVDLGDQARPAITIINDTIYLVGNAAKLYAVPRWSRDKASDPDTLRLMLVAAADHGASGSVTVATGLPLAWFGSGRQPFQEALTGFGGTVTLPNGVTRRVWFGSVLVLPQGVAAASTVFMRPEYEAGDYLIIDIGYRTTDFVVVTKTAAGQLVFHPDLADSTELGAHAVNVWVANRLKQQYTVPFQPAEVEDRKQLHIHGELVDLLPLRQAALQHLQTQLRDRLIEKLDQTWDKLAGKVLVGGGALLYADAFPDAVIPQNPQWANAQAYLTTLKTRLHVAT
jgi:actin-like ATPase involved in cell morphogenesis